jgi:hypothetical protein
MAENRTFKFYGIGLGDTPVTLTATVNSTQIFSGTIPTQPGSVPPVYAIPPDAAYETVMFSLDNSALLNTDFAGSLPMTIQISGGNAVIMSEIQSNYFAGNIEVNPQAGTVDNFGLCYNGIPVNSESTPDTRSSVYINGAQQVPPLAPSAGCWVWQVPSPATITCNWNISTGQIGNVPGNIAAYVAP